MDDIETDMEPAIEAASKPGDRGESTGLMEPLLVPEASRHRSRLMDLAVELAAGAAGFRRSLEGAMKNDYSVDCEKRGLQLEAKAQIAVFGLRRSRRCRSFCTASRKATITGGRSLTPAPFGDRHGRPRNYCRGLSICR